MEYYENELKSVLGNLVALYIRLTLIGLQCIACSVLHAISVGM